MRCHGYNQNIASKSNRRWLKNYEKLVVRIGTDILKIMAVVVLCDTSYFCIAFGRTHPTSGTKCFQIIADSAQTGYRTTFLC